MDHLGAALALGLGLARDRAHHRLVDVHVLDLHVRHLDAPRVGLRVEHRLDVDIELLALGEQRVELMLAQHGPQGGLRELAGGLEEVRHLDDGVARVDDAEVDHRVHFHRDVVARDDVLRRHVEHARAQVHAHELLDARDDHDQPRAEHALETSQEKHHRALVLAQDLDRQREQDDAEDHEAKNELDHASTSTVSTRPSIDLTRRRWPRRTGAAERTRQVSPCTRAQPSAEKSSSASAGAPIRYSRPVTTGRLRLRAAMPTTKKRRAALAAVTPAISGYGISKPGMLASSIRMMEPMTKAIRPPTPSDPKAGRKASATMNAMPSTMSASPA